MKGITIDRPVGQWYIVSMAQKGHRTKAGDRTRAAILEAAVRLLGRDGPDEFSASALAKETGVSKATLFHHFRTIDEIPLLALEQFWAQSLSLNTGRIISTRAYLQELGGQVIALARKRATFLRAHIVFLIKAMFDPRLHERLAKGSAQMHQLMTQELSGRLPNTLSGADIEAMARMVEMALDGLMVGVAANNTSRGLTQTRRAWARFVELLLADVETK